MRGTSMVELLFAIAIVGVAVMIQVQQVTVTLREFNIDAETQFAFHKASGMLAELQASVDSGVIDTPEKLEAVGDTEPNPFLTTRFVEEPDHIMSGNSAHGSGAWQWFRAISVEPIEGVEHSRFVRVRMFRADASGHRTLAALASGVLSVTIRAEPVVQEYDVYALAIAEAPSTWRPLPELRAQLASMVSEIEGTNPNLRVRVHWITSMGYGRDPCYVPYVNEAQAADVAAPWTYWYPGKLGATAPYSRLYAAELFGGRVRTEAGVLHDFDADTNPFPHAVADRFNHCVRTPEARAIFAARVAAGLDKEDEPPLQVLLADMCENPARYETAILLNLHGEGLPFPPLRNYADAARDPEGHPGVRVVTHPAQLHTPSSGTTPVEFRVYAYKSDPDTGPTVLTDPITVQIFGGDFRASLVVDAQVGGVDIQSGEVGTGLAMDRRYSFGGAVAEHSESHAPFEVNYEVGYTDDPVPHTFVRLYNTPLVCATELGAGIAPLARLYGREYVPSPVQDIGGFYAMTNASVLPIAKNTARWRIRVSSAGLASVFGQSAVVTAATRIGTDTTTGAMWPTPHQPQNISTTYAWWTPSASDVPATERYQILGDPRHNPYIDLCVAGASFEHGYNWWFDDLRDATADVRGQWTALDTARLRDGFGRGTVEDVPRIMQVWREALQRTHAVLVNPGGALAARVLLGGEVFLPGDASTATPAAIAVHGELYGQSTPQFYLDDLSASAAGGSMSIVAPAGERAAIVSTAGFLALPWLGELAPDVAWPAYQADGNLATQAGFRHALTGTAKHPSLPRGTAWDWFADSTLADLGAASLLWTDSDTSTFTQFGGKASSSLPLTESALSFVRAVGVSIPSAATSGLGCTLSGSLGAALPQRPYAAEVPTQTATLLEAFTAAPTGDLGAGVIRLAEQGSSAKVAFLVPLADTPAGPEEQRALMAKAVAFGLRGLMVAGEPDRSDDVGELPTVRIDLPSPATALDKPTTEAMKWSTSFVRFDGQPYTERYPSSWSGSEFGLEYVLTYRAEDSSEYRYVVDGSVAQAGERPASALLRLADSGLGSESYLLSMPSDRFPAGRYFLRVDCFRSDVGVHVAHHEVLVRVKR
ncbi:MAG: hypothetical protein R3F56_01675 [Planctomycetota bacterium]